MHRVECCRCTLFRRAGRGKYISSTSWHQAQAWPLGDRWTVLVTIGASNFCLVVSLLDYQFWVFSSLRDKGSTSYIHMQYSKHICTIFICVVYSHIHMHRPNSRCIMETLAWLMLMHHVILLGMCCLVTVGGCISTLVVELYAKL